MHTTMRTRLPARDESLVQLGVRSDNWDYVVALAGNPNTGKSTVFNLLTGLRQHTGNWPGKTVTRAEGLFTSGGDRFKLVDLPGTYSLQAASADEEVARDTLLFGEPDVTVIVRRRHAARAQPEPHAPGAGDHAARGDRAQPDGRGAAPRHRHRPGGARARTRRAGGADGGTARRGRGCAAPAIQQVARGQVQTDPVPRAQLLARRGGDDRRGGGGGARARRRRRRTAAGSRSAC